MPKVKVIHEDGFFFNKEKHAKGTELEIGAGAVLQAGLHFQQVELIDQEKTPRKKNQTASE